MLTVKEGLSIPLCHLEALFNAGKGGTHACKRALACLALQQPHQSEAILR